MAVAMEEGKMCGVKGKPDLYTRQDCRESRKK